MNIDGEYFLDRKQNFEPTPQFEERQEQNPQRTMSGIKQNIEKSMDDLQNKAD